MYQQDKKVIPIGDTVPEHDEILNERLQSIDSNRNSFWSLFRFFSSSKKYSVAAANNNQKYYDDIRSGRLFGGRSKEPKFEYPAIPSSLGQTIDLAPMIERNKNSQQVIKKVLSIISEDVSQAVQETEKIPVAKQGERVLVTTDIYDQIHEARTKKDIHKKIKNNLRDIENILIYRQTLLEVMNQNNDGVQVAQVVPVDINNARSIITTK